MDSIRIRYTWRRKSDGKIDQSVYTIEEVEKDAPDVEHEEWDLVARDLWTGQIAKEKEIYNGDVISYISNGILQYRVVFWDNEGGLFLTRNAHFTDDMLLLGFGWLKANGIIKYEGNIHANPKLIKQD